MLYRLIFLILMLFAQSNYALDIDGIPHVGQKAQDSFQFDYTLANQHKAFAIAPGGAWSWVASKASEDEARQNALTNCSKYTQQKCVIYALNNSVLLNKQDWYGLWGPYTDKATAQKAEIGTQLGQRFYDVAYTNPQGEKRNISDAQGKITFVHFWGCWCPSCRYEFETLIDMYRILNDVAGDQIEFIVLQVREPITTARAWAKKNNVEALPLSDSGVKSSKDKQLTLKDGSRIDDRKLAKAFPASYVLDRNGLVLFSHMGSVSDWSEYVPFFLDAVRKTN